MSYVSALDRLNKNIRLGKAGYAIAISIASLLLVCFSSPAFSASADITVMKNVAYGRHEKQKMDVYRPRASEGAPVIFMVHGGAWRIGDKQHRRVYKNKVHRWVPEGFVFISVNYRMLPGTPVNEQADDIAKALAFAQQKAPSWGADPARFILMGHSAGAHLVSLLTASPGIAEKQGAKPWLGTVSIDSAVFNVEALMETRHPRLYDRAFGSDKRYWRSVSPYHLLEQAGPPLLAICSTTRRDKPCKQAEQFKTKAELLGREVEVLGVVMSHRETNAELGSDEQYTDSVEGFMGSLDERVGRLLAEKG